MASASGSVGTNSSEEKPCDQPFKRGKATPKKSYKCGVCDKEFRTPFDLRVHERVHTGERPFSCDYCSKSCSRAADLENHKRIHTGEKPYKCDQCTKCFRISSSLVHHQRVHSGEKPFGCSQCGKFFRTSSKLVEHERIHSNQKPYTCEVCNKTFSCLGNLKVHKRTHTGERPYLCQDCPKSFSRLHHLVIHKVVHSGEKPFKCDKCDTSFAFMSGMKRHQKKHKQKLQPRKRMIGKSPKCSICEETFSCELDLSIHLATHEKQSGQNVDRASSQIESECISENLSSEGDKESESEPLSGSVIYIKREAGLFAEHDLSSGQYSEYVETIVGQDFGVAPLGIKTEDCHPAEEKNSSSFEFVSLAFVEQSIDQAVEDCHDVCNIRIKEETIFEPMIGNI